MNTEQIVWNFLREKGLPEKSVAAVMGNIYAESGFNENAIEKGSGVGLRHLHVVIRKTETTRKIWNQPNTPIKFSMG